MLVDPPHMSPEILKLLNSQTVNLNPVPQMFINRSINFNFEDNVKNSYIEDNVNLKCGDGGKIKIFVLECLDCAQKPEL